MAKKQATRINSAKIMKEVRAKWQAKMADCPNCSNPDDGYCEKHFAEHGAFLVKETEIYTKMIIDRIEGR